MINTPLFAALERLKRLRLGQESVVVGAEELVDFSKNCTLVAEELEDGRLKVYLRKDSEVV